MSHTDRNEKRLPREREFPYVPRQANVPIVITGANYTAEENAKYVRSLLGPDLARDVELEALWIVSQQGR
jgi:hypothetical protein